MTKTRFLLSFSLILSLLAACAPGTTATHPPAAVTELPTDAPPMATEAAPSEEATALPIATSRGPNLEATDPTTVSLASGGLQFVEFFRFT